MKRDKEDTLQTKLKTLPRKAGVYLFKDKNKNIIYVGKAKNLRARVQSYFREGGDGRYSIQFLLPRIDDLDTMVTDTEQEALILENNLIKKYRPRYNVFLKDDKTYANLKLNVGHPFPRLTVVRNPRRDGSLYFGPYASARSVRATLRTIGKIFPMRTCSDAELKSRKRPCLYHYIERCSAPCVELVDHQTYKEIVDKVVMFLKGKGGELLKSLKDKMELAAAERQYELAGRLRDQQYAIRQTLERQRITSPQRAERDVFAVYREDKRMVIQSILVRDGRVSGGESFLFANANLPSTDHLSSFLSQYYQRGAVIPDEVVVSEEIDERDALEALLSSKREGSVKIILPKKGERRKLIDLACENAKTTFEGRAESTRNRELLEDLKALLELKNFPRRIECFDISNFQGKEAVGSRVAFIDADPARTLYRRYRIRTVEGANDYGMMEEVLRRRIARGVKEGDLPDLLIVDGGKGQLNVALQVIESLGPAEIDVLAIAKGRETRKAAKAGKTAVENSEETQSAKRQTKRIKGKELLYKPERSRPILLDATSTALFLLERIRDEAHRFAISYHKQLRSKRLTTSLLDDVPGVGPVLKRRILSHFGSVERIREATDKELAIVKGVSSPLAMRIKEYLGESS